MNILEFMKDFFDYDLSKDTERATALKKYTNVFM